MTMNDMKDYVPVSERGQPDTAVTEMHRLLDIVASQQRELSVLHKQAAAFQSALTAADRNAAAFAVERRALRARALDVAGERAANALLTDELDVFRGLLLWALWHHQGGSSPVGQPIRVALRIGQHDAMTAEQIQTGSDAAARCVMPNVRIQRTA